MDDYSRLEGTVPVSPASGGVRRVRKKGKTGDRNRQHGKRDQRVRREQGNKDEGPKPDVEEEVDQGSTGQKKRPSRKIDLVI